ncbi:hypothetical protein [Campylobacter estrildidarum]|uniref:Uncharacterized protein n=1 Tax=Campylobacter estrildidarum TaxID=2510189 RepID=A0A4U7BAK0_9BACT|nr:hypothetical protein [Campylobacter estrildidarum]TKX28243.1 hypothetical protein CQA69_08465 [Campylobacter estrildidarum]
MHFLAFVAVIAIVYYIIMFILENKKEKKKKIEDINKEISLIKANLNELNESFKIHFIENIYKIRKDFDETREKTEKDILLLEECCNLLLQEREEKDRSEDNDALKQLIEAISDDEHSIDENYKIDEDKREDIIDAMYKENENLKEKLSEYEKKFGKL